jgi:predicted kinase
MEKTFLEVVKPDLLENGLLISVGLPGSWKSPVTEAISKMKNFPILRSDLIRLEVLKDEDIFDNRVASDPNRRARVYEEMFQQAEKILKSNPAGLILDATFFSQDLRERAARLAETAKRPLVMIECICSEERSLQRIARRTRENYESNALTREAYLNIKTLFQPVDLNGLKKKFKNLSIVHLILDTESDSLSDWKIIEIRKR